MGLRKCRYKRHSRNVVSFIFTNSNKQNTTIYFAECMSIGCKFPAGGNQTLSTLPVVNVSMLKHPFIIYSSIHIQRKSIMCLTLLSRHYACSSGISPRIAIDINYWLLICLTTEPTWNTLSLSVQYTVTCWWVKYSRQANTLNPISVNYIN